MGPASRVQFVNKEERNLHRRSAGVEPCGPGKNVRARRSVGGGVAFGREAAQLAVRQAPGAGAPDAAAPVSPAATSTRFRPARFAA